MISINKYYLLPFSFLLISNFLSAQIDTNALKKFKPARLREIYNDYVDAQQKSLLKYDGKADNKLVISSNEEVNFLVTQAATIKIDWLQYEIENDSTLSHGKKVRYVQGLKVTLQLVEKGWKQKELNPANLPATIDAYANCVQLDKKGISIEEYISNLDYEVAMPVVNSIGFEENAGVKNSRNDLIRKFCLLYPEKTFTMLTNYPDVPFADSLVKLVAKKYPDQLYNYAQANNRLGQTIRGITDDVFIKSVVQMARSKSGQQYFPFLDNIVKGKMTIADIDAVKDDSIKYYKLLVKTQMEYVQRALNKDTAFEFESLTTKLEGKAQSIFVNTINGLHTVSDLAVRFRVIQPLNAQELYYVAVLSDGIIYTSSFVKGVYPLMMKKINQHGDSLLTLLKFDKYRKFIKMAAGYNTLSNFLSTFPKSKNPDEDDPANILMKAFVGRLEKSVSLEDGVDVADSYASIEETLKPLANEMLNNIQLNYQRNISQGNNRGIAIYNILTKLFLSADTVNHIDLTKELGIPPVYEVPFKALANDSGRVIIQLFIYGDKDGIGVFPGLLNMFSNANWNIDRSNPQWVTIKSVKGKPVSLYLNRPLPEETDQDAKAQEALCKYLEKNKYYPTVTINRGHSYNAPYTIEQMFSTSKIVFMGSCGGYRMIHDILEKAPDAHIIGTKQIADAPVNNPFLKLLTDKLREGNNIDWIPFWKELSKMATDEIFDDYVPPYKNLGALFIKAYKIAMEKSESIEL
jgi:hypothetical protein